MTRVAGIVLAAGASRRMGQDKRLLEVEGTPMIQRAVTAARGAGLDPVLVVCGPGPALPLPPGITLVINPNPEDGMGGSLAAGVAALGSDSQAVVVLLADMPKIEPRHVMALVAAFAPEAGADIVVPVCGGRRGNPVLLGRKFFAAMALLTGDKGARGLLRDHLDSVVEVEMDQSVLLDVDTPEDLAKLEGRS